MKRKKSSNVSAQQVAAKNGKRAKTPVKTLKRLLSYAFSNNKLATAFVVVFVFFSSVAHVVAASRISYIITELIENGKNADMWGVVYDVHCAENFEKDARRNVCENAEFAFEIFRQPHARRPHESLYQRRRYNAPASHADDSADYFFRNNHCSGVRVYDIVQRYSVTCRLSSTCRHNFCYEIYRRQIRKVLSATSKIARQT